MNYSSPAPQTTSSEQWAPHIIEQEWVVCVSNKLSIYIVCNTCRLLVNRNNILKNYRFFGHLEAAETWWKYKYKYKDTWPHCGELSNCYKTVITVWENRNRELKDAKMLHKAEAKRSSGWIISLLFFVVLTKNSSLQTSFSIN